MTEAIRHLTIQDFDSFINIHKQPILVDFWAPWCGPCRQMSPILERLSLDLGQKAHIAKVNVDENPELAERFGIRSIPTLVLIKEGKEEGRFVGLQGPESLKSAILGKSYTV